jgi:hypothetical protein
MKAMTEIGMTAAHNRLTVIVQEADDAGLRDRAENLLEYYDNTIVTAFHEGRGDDAETADDMRRFQAMANRLFRDAYRAGVMA